MNQKFKNKERNMNEEGKFNVTYGDCLHISGFTVVDNISFVWEQVQTNMNSKTNMSESKQT